MTALVEVDQLSRYYGHLRAVDNVSFTLEKGQILGFLGPNGAGKSSTMQIICGSLSPSVGQVRINGIDILDQPIEAKRQLGYLPEIPPLYRELTVNEYLSYCGRLNRVPRKELKPAVERAKERCGLTEVGSRLIGNLSKGYQQRVGIAQAILHLPAVIVLDEPTVGLDPIQIVEIRQLIRELGAEHGVILSTHILSEVQESCTHVQIINHGRLVFHDSITGMARRMQASSLILATRHAPAQEGIAALEHVQHVEEIAPNRLRIVYDRDTNPAEQLAEMAYLGGWGLLELAPERRSLEEIFVEITQHSDATEALQ